MVTCPWMFSSSTSDPRPCRSTLPLDVDGANHFAASDFDPRIAADARDAHVGAVGDQFDVALDVAHFEVARAAARFDGHTARHGHFEIVGDPLVVGRAVLVGADQQAVALRHDFDRRVVVGAVGVVAVPGADRSCGRSRRRPACRRRSPGYCRAGSRT